MNAASDDPSRRRNQPEDGQRSNGLPAAAFADKAQRLACLHREGDAIHRLRHTAVGEEVGLEIIDFQESA